MSKVVERKLEKPAGKTPDFSQLFMKLRSLGYEILY